MNRSKRASVAEETLKIVEQGWYQPTTGGKVDIAAMIKLCNAGTKLFTPEELDRLVDSIAPASHGTRFEVRNETTLSAASRLVVEQQLKNCLALNFASAKNPGGGFLGGSQAQEESLARCSSLYDSLVSQETYYRANRMCGTCLYTDHMILSPEVPVFRSDDGRLLDVPYQISILTAPAVNAGAVRKESSGSAQRIESTMATRIAKVLAIAANQGYEHLILGAWGCGVFRNDPAMIARLFADHLLGEGHFRGQFQSVCFAVLDNTEDHRIIRPFQDCFNLAGSTSQ